MKRIQYVWLAAMVLMGAVALSSAQSSASADQNSQNTDGPSLGSYARTLRKDKKETVKKYDNDNLPMADKISVVGDKDQPSAPDAQAGTQGPEQAAASASAGPQVQPGQSQEEMQKVYSQWQGKIADQQSAVDLLSRELDVTQREYRLRQAAMYGDAGDRFRNQAAWDKEDADYKQKLAEKQKALDDAKQKMSDLQEDARKSGVPESVRENTEKQQGQPDEQ